MSDKVYLQPVGISGDLASSSLCTLSDMLPLVGGPLYFAGALILERCSRKVKSRYFTARKLLAVKDSCLRRLVERVTVAPPSVFALNRKRYGPLIMGIVNVTPDSFSDGGFFFTPDGAVAHAHRLIEEGADIIDIGGESTRPGAVPVSVAVERARVMPVLQALRNNGVVVSLDTRKAALMTEAALLDVDIINDVSALTYDSQSASILSSRSCAVILMHSKGTPETMRNDSYYDDVVLDVYDALEERVRAAEAAGIARARLIVDPGIGFGKKFAHNLEILRRLALFHGLGIPLMLGVSRKGIVGHVTGVRVASERVAGSVAMALAGVNQGVHMLRVHDVAATRQALSAWCAVVSGDG